MDQEAEKEGVDWSRERHSLTYSALSVMALITEVSWCRHPPRTRRPLGSSTPPLLKLRSTGLTWSLPELQALRFCARPATQSLYPNELPG